MTPRGHERLFRLAALLLIVLPTKMSAGSDQQDDDPRDHVPRAELHYYAIVGAVHAPATYASEQSAVPVRDVVQRAGGLTDSASGGIRIIHRGRQDQVFSTPGQELSVSLRVPSGAVIVVESTHASADASQSADTVHVACDQLLQRPVVLGGDANRMTLPQLLEALGQPGLPPQSIQVLPRTVQLGRETLIPTGTVLIFDPASIDQAALQQVLHQYPLQDVVPLIESDDQRQPPTVMAEINPRVALEVPQNSDHVNVAPAPPAEIDAGPRLNPATVPDLPVAPAHIPVIEEAQQVTEASVLRTVDTDPEEDAFNAELVVLNELFQHAAESKASTPIRAGKPDVAGVPDSGTMQLPPGSPAQTGFGSQVVFASAAAGGLALLAIVGAVVWSRRERRRLRARRREISQGLAGTAFNTPPPQRHPLDLLINDELPVVVEEVVFPEGTEFHGRAVGFRYLVHHEPQSLHGPHFATASRASDTAAVTRQREVASKTAAAATSQSEPPGQPVGPAGRPRRTTAGTVSPLERALRAQQWGTSR